jgi:hypothetical protein
MVDLLNTVKGVSENCRKVVRNVGINELGQQREVLVVENDEGRAGEEVSSFVAMYLGS